MAAISRYYDQEAQAVLSAALESARANDWPSYLTSAITPMIRLADDRTDPGDGGTPARGAWLAALAAIWIAELEEDPAPGWVKVGGFIGDAANLALSADYKAATAPSAFQRVWDQAKKAGRVVLEEAAEVAEKAGKAITGLSSGLLLPLGLAGLGLAFAGRILAKKGGR